MPPFEFAKGIHFFRLFQSLNIVRVSRRSHLLVTLWVALYRGMQLQGFIEEMSPMNFPKEMEKIGMMNLEKEKHSRKINLKEKLLGWSP